MQSSLSVAGLTLRVPLALRPPVAQSLPFRLNFRQPKVIFPQLNIDIKGGVPRKNAGTPLKEAVNKR